MSAVRILSFHAGYGCRHRGRCCSSGWPIEVDAPQAARIEGAIEAGVINVARPGFEGRVLATIQGRCVFHDDNADGACRIHRALGHQALPLACRQFPRQSVRDPRGVSITLSHYCPTAHDLLLTTSAPVNIIDNVPAFPSNAEYVGLTADPALPPLLHPKLAMDWESWWRFEELAVSLLADAPQPLTRLGVAVEHARAWSVGQGPLLDHIHEAFDRARAAEVISSAPATARITARIAEALAGVPEEWRDIANDALASPSAPEVRSSSDIVRRRYLAAHAFANWAAYQGEGLRTWFRAVETADALLIHTGDPGQSDLVLRHLADSTMLVRQWNRAEREPAGAPGQVR